MYNNTWKQEICSHLSYGFFFLLFVEIVSRKLVEEHCANLCSASYNIAINIANCKFSYISETLRVSCFLSKGIVNSSPVFSSVTKSHIASLGSVSLKEIADRSCYLLNKPFKLNSIRRNLLCVMKIVLSFRLLSEDAANKVAVSGIIEAMSFYEILKIQYPNTVSALLYFTNLLFPFFFFPRRLEPRGSVSRSRPRRNSHYFDACSWLIKID